jgi:hypothetical protein
MTEPTMTFCHQCDRGGNGNDKDPCSAGWKRTEPSYLGCFLGTPIVGEPKKHPKLSRSQKRYQRFLNMDGCCGTFRDFLIDESKGLI